MARKFSKKITRKTRVRLSLREAEEIIKQEFTTKYGNRIQKRFIFKPQAPNEPTIDFEVKGNRKEAE